ncbi:DUF881 domain-containing protein [Georgenia yuyongxinii]|uniref:DUF881 domain-containing protein n=1 Tax=Georgenia yuyongxinii TaxID=2589797 RepID=A0A5B8BY84_9MICO|nr:DUF881 domain-containing protein [Georgenia yuyongxinii]QDC23244.1 DUF881 domain-containing protein [Georgenia yuyongxinii]
MSVGPAAPHDGDAARTGPPSPPAGHRPVPSRSIATAVVAALAGLLFATNAQVFAGDEDRHPQNLEDLARVESARLERLEAENAALRGEVRGFLGAEEKDPEAGPAGRLAAQAAGQSAATGPGLMVELWDAPQQTDGLAATLPPDSLVVHQQDIEGVMNALWAGGAEAMTVQGHRVVSTTGVRCVGNVLHIDGRTYSPPYEIQAIGDPGMLRDSLLADPRVQVYLDYVEAVGLGWSVRPAEKLALPAYAGSLTLTHAQVLNGPGSGA